MTTTTANLGLFKYVLSEDGNKAFNIETALNDNWDKIDDAFSSTDIIGTLKIIYPVGCVYLTTNSTCPLSALFGTWTLVSSDRALWTGTGNNGGTTIAAGLPNITGTVYFNESGFSSCNGCFNTDENKPQIPNGNNEKVYNHLFFDASGSNTIYGNSTTVQPPAYVVNVFRRTA